MGTRLDGVTVRPSNAENNKWLVFFGGNCSFYENNLNPSMPGNLYDFARRNKINVITINYRGVGDSGSGPSRFSHLFMDGRAAVDYLLKQGIPKENITVEGQSIGGAVAIQTAHRFKLRCIVNNTFASTSAVVPYFLRHGAEGLDKLYRQTILTPNKALTIKERVLFLLKDSIGELFEIAFRVTYFVLAFLYHCIHGDFERAAYDIFEILKTVVLGIGIICTCWSPEKSAKLHQLMIAKEGTLIYQILTSSNLLALVHKILSATGWNVDSKATWDQMEQDQKMAFWAPNDDLIPPAAALGPEEGLGGFQLSQTASHGTRAIDDEGSRAKYHEFLQHEEDEGVEGEPVNLNEFLAATTPDEFLAATTPEHRGGAGPP